MHIKIFKYSSQHNKNIKNLIEFSQIQFQTIKELRWVKSFAIFW